MLEEYEQAMKRAKDPHAGDAYRAIVLRLRQGGTHDDLLAWVEEQRICPRFAHQDHSVLLAFARRLKGAA